MAIEVRIPTILRTHTSGEKVVEGDGSTLGELLVDLETRHNGLQARLIDDGKLRRLDTPVKDGDTVTILPAVAGG
jgi:molybdopterin synthase sulfur carrier subunit